MGSSKRKSNASEDFRTPAKRSKNVAASTSGAANEVRKEKARNAARQKAEEIRQKEAEKNAYLDQLVAEMGIKPGGRKATSAAAKAKARSANASSAHKEQAKGEMSSVAGSFSPVKSTAAALTEQASPIKDMTLSDTALPTPAAEPDLSGGATAGILTFKTVSAADVKHKRDRKAFKKGAEEATRERGLKVDSTQWLDDRAGIRIHWSRSIDDDDDGGDDGEDNELDDQDERDELEQSPVATVAEKAVKSSVGLDAPEKQAESSAAGDGNDMDVKEEAKTAKSDEACQHEPAYVTRPGEQAPAERGTVPAFSQAEFDNLFEREEAVPSDEAWALIADDVVLLHRVVEEPLDDDEEKKARVHEHLEAIRMMVDAIGEPAEGEDEITEASAVQVKGQSEEDDGFGYEDFEGLEDDGGDVDVAIEGSDG